MERRWGGEGANEKKQGAVITTTERTHDVGCVKYQRRKRKFYAKSALLCGKNTKRNGDKQVEMATVPLKINDFGEQNTGFAMKKGKKCCRK
jgi:hypothetical protein